MIIYGDRQSGNCYKVQLTADLLALDYQWQDVDILAGDTKQADFLTQNPNGKIPFVVLNDGRTLSESNAIINFLASGSALYPTDRYQQAKIQQWQFFEQYSHEPYIAVARFINKYLGLPQDKMSEYQAKQKGGHKALTVMAEQLSKTPYLTGSNMTTADICLFAYTHVAHEGGFDLAEYPALLTWIDRIQALDNFSAMPSN